MSVKYAPSKLKVPNGFQNLLEGLAREVLREQPEDIIKFAADYFKEQLKIRENEQFDNQSVPETTTKEVSNEKRSSVASEKDHPLPVKKRDSVESQRSSISSKKNSVSSNPPVAVERESTADSIKKESELLPEPALEAEAISGESQLTEEDAAIKIQSIVRGHQAREGVKALKSASVEEAATEDGENQMESKAGPESEDVMADDTNVENVKEQEAAAIKIQSSFRGFQARKDVKVMKAASKDEVLEESQENVIVSETVADVEATPDTNDSDPTENPASETSFDAEPDDAKPEPGLPVSTETRDAMETHVENTDAEDKNEDTADKPEDAPNAEDAPSEVTDGLLEKEGNDGTTSEIANESINADLALTESSDDPAAINEVSTKAEDDNLVNNESQEEVSKSPEPSDQQLESETSGPSESEKENTVDEQTENTVEPPDDQSTSDEPSEANNKQPESNTSVEADDTSNRVNEEPTSPENLTDTQSSTGDHAPLKDNDDKEQ